MIRVARPAGEAPLVLDSPPPKSDVAVLMAAETRFQVTAPQDPERYRTLVGRVQEQIHHRWELYTELSRKPGAPD